MDIPLKYKNEALTQLAKLCKRLQNENGFTKTKKDSHDYLLIYLESCIYSFLNVE